MKLPPLLVPALVAVALISPATAQQAQTSPGGSMSGMQNMSMTPAQKEFHQAMQNMNAEMMQGMMDSDPGRSWMKQMIAHHQGAVDMSEIILKYSKDSDVVKEARKTKEENERGIRELQAKLRKEEK
ncbi:DUF305 domain-containing protein [Methylocystis echinoides]|uniref:DUF305 domain-containing protein n=1 Tax=Methylocystis echinoides TaxID=29468 RepID=A0A9W6LTU9_9HYPH|nr:DUF305 domain-containing protein [Methylocystis echinoides]RTL85982.1 MAG: DUF305 domain-containing protein [Hyphomicrobiales bacterium]GLI95105.1 hypothetical protein LMG27198_40970 [Methylocystis echinoides]